jgi:hypothetical protein
MRRARWLNKGFAGTPAIYHCIDRVVDRKLVLGDEENVEPCLLTDHEYFSMSGRSSAIARL